MQSLPCVVGHRGASGHAPENTIKGFEVAAGLGALWVEFDVQLASDGVAMVFHDDDLSRTTNGTGNLADLPSEEIIRLDAGSWFDPAFAAERVPTLSGAIDALSRLGLAANVEIKPSPGMEAETGVVTGKLLAAEWPDDLPSVLISSFCQQSLKSVHCAAPQFQLALNVWEVPENWHQLLDRLNCGALHCLHTALEEAQARKIIEAGFKLRCFTVNEPEIAQRLWGWGVETVFSDFPDRFGKCP